MLQEKQIQYEKLEQREQDLSTKLDKAQSVIEKQTHLISDLRVKSSQKPVESPKSIFRWFRTRD